MGKPGRPRLAAADIRRQRDVWYSDKEWAEIRAGAQRAGWRAGKYARHVSLGQRVKTIPAINSQAWAVLGRVGGNLNQIATVLNIGGSAPDLQLVLSELSQQIAALRLQLIGVEPEDEGDDR